MTKDEAIRTARCAARREQSARYVADYDWRETRTFDVFTWHDLHSDEARAFDARMVAEVLPDGSVTFV